MPYSCETFILFVIFLTLLWPGFVNKKVFLEKGVPSLEKWPARDVTLLIDTITDQPDQMIIKDINTCNKINSV